MQKLSLQQPVMSLSWMTPSSLSSSLPSAVAAAAAAGPDAADAAGACAAAVLVAYGGQVPGAAVRKPS